MSELKPCPLCGALPQQIGTMTMYGEPSIFPPAIWVTSGMEGVKYVRERTCHDTGESRVFRCSGCGFGLFDVYMDDELEWDASFCDFPPYCPKCGARVERGDA